MIDSLKYAKLPLDIKRSLNLVSLESGTYDQIVAYFESELEFSSMENVVELSIPTLTAVTPNGNPKKLNRLKLYAFTVKNLAT